MRLDTGHWIWSVLTCWYTIVQFSHFLLPALLHCPPLSFSHEILNCIEIRAWNDSSRRCSRGRVSLSGPRLGDLGQRSGQQRWRVAASGLWLLQSWVLLQWRLESWTIWSEVWDRGCQHQSLDLVHCHVLCGVWVRCSARWKVRTKCKKRLKFEWFLQPVKPQRRESYMFGEKLIMLEKLVKTLQEEVSSVNIKCSLFRFN